MPLYNPASASGYSTVEDEGVPQTQRSTLNFVGAGVVASDVGGKTQVSISGGGAGAANFGETSITLGNAGVYSVVVTGQAWVTATSNILASIFGTTADGGTPDLAAVADLAVIVSDRVVGTGFTIWVYNPYGASGTYRVHWTGA